MTIPKICKLIVHISPTFPLFLDVTDAKIATGIHWNYKAPINNDTITNATRAAQLNRLMYRNGTIGRHVNAVFINGTWVDPIDNATLAANAAAEAAAKLNTGEVRGCTLNLKPGFTLDPFVGEWCSLDARSGGFMFRGVRNNDGHLFLQRFRLLKHKSLHTAASVANMTVNGVVAAANATLHAAANATLYTAANATATELATAELLQVDSDLDMELDNIGEIESGGDNIFPGTTEPAAPEAPAPEEGEASFVEAEYLEAEEELILMEMDMEMSMLTANPKSAEVKKRGILKVLNNGDVLPDLPELKLSRCTEKAAEYLFCSETNPLPMNGTESAGFCQTDQYSADTALFISDYVDEVKNYKPFLDKVVVSTHNMAPTHKSTDSLNHQDDAVKFCFMPGSATVDSRYSAKGNYHSRPVGDSTGFFKPVLRMQCDSVYCKISGLVSGKKSTVVLNFKPL